MAKHTFPALTSQFAVACNLTALYLIMTLREGSVGRMFPLSLLAYAPLLYLLNRLYLRRERTLRGVILLNLAVAACFLSVCILVDGRPEVAALAFMLILVAWLTIKGQSLALKPPQMSGMPLFTWSCTSFKNFVNFDRCEPSVFMYLSTSGSMAASAAIGS